MTYALLRSDSVPGFPIRFHTWSLRLEFRSLRFGFRSGVKVLGVGVEGSMDVLLVILVA